MNQSEKMLHLVEEFFQSGKSQNVFCQEHNLKFSTFGYWIRKRKLAQSSTSGFIKVESPSQFFSSPDPICIIYPNGVQLKVSGFDLQIIRSLVSLN